MVATVLGTQAFDYLIANPVSKTHLIAIGSDKNLQNKLSDLLDRPNVSNFSWNYAIFWKISHSKSRDLFLGWGDSSCREPREGEESETTRILNLRLEDGMQEMRKRVLQKFYKLFQGSDEDNYAQGLDRCFASGKHVLLFGAQNSSSDYCVRSFLARAAGIQTIILVPTDVGVVELGSVRSLGECLELLKSIRSFFSSQPSLRFLLDFFVE
ncbi:hypothetical protein UlMin_032174 [Ulmus minor]